MPRTDEEINDEIRKYGYDLYIKIREAVLEEATKPTPYSSQKHEENKRKLKKEIVKIIKGAEFNPKISTNELWQNMWQKIFYAGTSSEKASNEIEDMKERSIFKNIEKFDEAKWKFDESDKKCWKEFRNYWKGKHKLGWLEIAKNHEKYENYDVSVERHLSKMGAKAKELMTKSGDFNGCLFSADEDKMFKYVNIAKILTEKKTKKDEPILKHFADNYQDKSNSFSILWEEFTKLMGPITALHLLMDLGYDCVKPDRVLTKLFCCLGWLTNLPKDTKDLEINKKYEKEIIINEVIERAKILAEGISANCDKKINLMRSIDIWFVKYGQEPEKSMGIECNLHDNEKPIQELYDEVIKAKNT